jgi:hypothetical protein
MSLNASFLKRNGIDTRRHRTFYECGVGFVHMSKALGILCYPSHIMEGKKVANHFIMIGKSSKSKEEEAYFILHDVHPTRTVIPPTKHNDEPSFQSRGNGRTKNILTTDSAQEIYLVDKRTIVVLLDEKGLEYPTSTSRYCYTDHNPIDWPPMGCPIAKTVLGMKTAYHCIRFMCSLECAQLFAKHHFRDNSKQLKETLELLDAMNAKVLKALGEPYATLRDALDPNLLKVTGSGDMDIDTYRGPSSRIKYVKSTLHIIHAQEVYEKVLA